MDKVLDGNLSQGDFSKKEKKKKKKRMYSAEPVKSRLS